MYPCRGEYLILDKRLNGSLSTLVYPAPRKGGAGLGIHLTNTVDGNILIGPSNEYVDHADDYACTADIIAQLKKEGRELLPAISTSDFIRGFSGLRPKQTPPSVKGFKEFRDRSRKDIPGFINLVGIESPGLTCSPAIGLMVRDMVGKRLPLDEKDHFISERNGFPGFFHDLPDEEKADLVVRIPTTVKLSAGVSRSPNGKFWMPSKTPWEQDHCGNQISIPAMMGRCQGGFCLPRIVQILERISDTGRKISALQP
jgi:glycerol-3-phosphate dehydrogenase